MQCPECGNKTVLDVAKCNKCGWESPLCSDNIASRASIKEVCQRIVPFIALSISYLAALVLVNRHPDSNVLIIAYAPVVGVICLAIRQSIIDSKPSFRFGAISFGLKWYGIGIMMVPFLLIARLIMRTINDYMHTFHYL